MGKGLREGKVISFEYVDFELLLRSGQPKCVSGASGESGQLVRRHGVTSIWVGMAVKQTSAEQDLEEPHI